MAKNEVSSYQFNRETPEVPRVRNFESAVEVLPSLEVYKQQVHHKLPEIMDSVKRSDQVIPGTFALSELHSGMGTTIHGFHQDGSFGFSLGYKEHPSEGFSWFAHTSFTVPTQLYWVPFESLNEILSKQNQNAPVIVQLQARNKSEQDKRILQQYRWEFALTRLVKDWAQAAGAKQLYMLPSDMNSFAGLGNQRFRMRYDVTASRMGFEKVAGGLHALVLNDTASQNH